MLHDKRYRLSLVCDSEMRTETDHADASLRQDVGN